MVVIWKALIGYKIKVYFSCTYKCLNDTESHRSHQDSGNGHHILDFLGCTSSDHCTGSHLMDIKKRKVELSEISQSFKIKYFLPLVHDISLSLQPKNNPPSPVGENVYNFWQVMYKCWTYLGFHIEPRSPFHQTHQDSLFCHHRVDSETRTSLKLDTELKEWSKLVGRWWGETRLWLDWSLKEKKKVCLMLNDKTHFRPLACKHIDGILHTISSTFKSDKILKNWELTAVHFIRAVQAVLLSITYEFLWDAAFCVSTAVLTALSLFPAVPFVRPIPTLRFPIAHFSLGDAHFPMGTLKLP